jgi:hypothetical protein
LINGRNSKSGSRKPAARLNTAQREAKANARDKYVARKYGITAAMYRDLESWQGGKCYGCRRATGASRELAVDHDHATGEVRMLLCSTCNNIVGHFRDDPKTFIRMGLALIQPPSRVVWSSGIQPQWIESE